MNIINRNKGFKVCVRRFFAAAVLAGPAILALAPLPSALAADNQPRVNAMSHSCEALQALIEDNGSAIIRYPSARNPSLTLYDRYIRRGMTCDNRQMVETTHIPARDTDRCAVRHCVPADCDPDDAFCFSQ